MNTSPKSLQPTRASVKAQQAVRKLADSAQMLVWMTDANDVCIYLNESARALFDEEDQFDISAWVQFMHPEDLARVYPIFLAAKENRSEYQVEYRIVRSDGSCRWMMGTGAARFTSTGDYVGYNGTLVDVSQHYSTLDRMTRSEAAYRLLSDNSSDLITRHAPSGECLYASPSARRLLGYAPHDLIGLSACDKIHPDEHHLVAREIERQVSDDAESRLIELRLLQQDGSYRWMGTKLQVLIDPVSGALINMVAVSRDMTAERQARDELRKREERFSSLTTLSADWYWETDDLGRYTFLSEGIRNALGIAPESVYGLTLAQIAGNPEHPGLLAYQAHWAARTPFRNLQFTGTVPGTGEIRHTRESGEPVFDGGRFTGYRGVTSDITEQVRKSEHLARLAAENETLVENSPDLIVLMNIDGQLLRVNQAAWTLGGYRPEELMGNNFLQYIHPEDMEKTLQIVVESRETMTPVRDFESRCLRKDGTIIHLSWSGTWRQDGTVMYCVARDVSERFHAREARQEALDRLQRVLESIGDGFFTVDRNWQVTYVNRIAADFFARPRDEFIGRHVESAIPAIIASPFFNKYQRAMEHGETASFETYYPLRDAWAEVRLYPHADGISVFFSDITRKREIEKLVRLSEQRFREVVEMTPAGYILTDANGLLTEVNPALCELSGWSAPELLGRSLNDLFSDTALDVLLTSSHADKLEGIEGVVRHKLGHTVYVLINAHLRHGGNGELLSITAFLTDITARKHSELETRQRATHDILTGLPNRAYLDECLPGILGYAARGRVSAVLYIDLDRFKRVNDTLGHAAGDELLLEIASRIKQLTRQSDIVARLGGDEFVVIAQCEDGANSAQTIAEKLIAAIIQPVLLQGQEMFIGASIGISLWPQDGSSKDELFKKADAAMYQVKSTGRNGYRFYQEG